MPEPRRAGGHPSGHPESRAAGHPGAAEDRVSQGTEQGARRGSVGASLQESGGPSISSGPPWDVGSCELGIALIQDPDTSAGISPGAVGFGLQVPSCHSGKEWTQVEVGQ